MSLYAIDDGDLIHAADAEPRKCYSCSDCLGPVKKRQGRMRFPHFYHLKTSPSCRLYSKTERHLLAQLQLQKLFPAGDLQLERTFPEINRVADVCWEKEKIVFEIQCSQLTEKEAEMRDLDYRSIGYETVWLLDDKRYNRRVIRPAEGYLRKHGAYYLSIGESLFSEYYTQPAHWPIFESGWVYDQFEIVSEGRRVKKGKKMPVDLQKNFRGPKKSFDEALFPKQIVELNSSQYFQGDRYHRALQNHSLAMLHFRSLEIHALKKESKPISWLRSFISRTYITLLETALRGR